MEAKLTCHSSAICKYRKQTAHQSGRAEQPGGWKPITSRRDYVFHPPRTMRSNPVELCVSSLWNCAFHPDGTVCSNPLELRVSSRWECFGSVWENSPCGKCAPALAVCRRLHRPEEKLLSAVSAFAGIYKVVALFGNDRVSLL